MAKAVKTRSYESPRRREQAAATRAAILDAAQLLFERQGYAATTMAAIASEAGVALKTVYVAFDTKSGVLRALWNLLLRGDQDDAPVAERSWYREILDEPDPERQLRLNARNALAVKTRIGGVLQVIRNAAPVDPDIEALWGRIESDFHANQRVVVEQLAKKKALRRGLGVDRAADILWTLNHPDVWHLLVDERGWSGEQWERWFAGAACTQLLDPR
jgi:AcrR family transcriptional regulator